MSAFSMQTDVLGLEEIRAEFKRMDRALKKEISKEVRRGTNYLKNKIRAATPVDSGDLKKATKSRVRGMDGRIVIDKDAWYWLVVEYGSDVRGVQGTLYSQKVIERERPVAQQMIADGVDKVLRG